MKFSGSQKNADAFTLIELVISAALMAVILSGAYACLNAGFAGQRMIEPRADVMQQARIVLSLITADLRSACLLPKGSAFLGVQRMIGTVEADNLDFATHHYSPKNEGEGDFCEQSYFVEVDPRTGVYRLFRRRNPTMAFDPLSGGSREELASGIRGFRLEYFDGYDWYESWGDPNPGSAKSLAASAKPNGSGMPEAVRITLSFDPGPQNYGKRNTQASSSGPLVFQTVARLNLPTRDSSGQSDGKSTSGAGTTESQPSNRR